MGEFSVDFNNKLLILTHPHERSVAESWERDRYAERASFFAVCGDLADSIGMFSFAFDTTSCISPAVSSRLICFAPESPK
jgi:hypothetical protein